MDVVQEDEPLTELKDSLQACGVDQEITKRESRLAKSLGP